MLKIVEEVWRDIPNYENYYQISNYGNVRSLTREILNRGIKRKRIGKLMKPHFNKTNKNKAYYQTEFCKFGIQKRFLIHVLVAQAFIPNPENKSQVNHKDFDRKNNHINNLEWCSQLENMHHAKINKRLKPPILLGEKHGGHKLKEDQVLDIRKKYENFSQNQLAKMFGVSRSAIQDIVLGRSWSWLH